jgi:hypothetical protein
LRGGHVVLQLDGLARRPAATCSMRALAGGRSLGSIGSAPEEVQAGCGTSCASGEARKLNFNLRSLLTDETGARNWQHQQAPRKCMASYCPSSRLVLPRPGLPRQQLAMRRLVISDGVSLQNNKQEQKFSPYRQNNKHVS